MDKSILLSIKHLVGIVGEDESFDLDLITHINSGFTVLEQYGLRPFSIESADETWTHYLPLGTSLQLVKSWMLIHVRLIFDPPATSFTLQALKQQQEEFSWRIMEQNDFMKGRLSDGE